VSDSALRVLVVEDNDIDARLILHELRKAGFDPMITRVQTEAAYLAHLNPLPEIILCDYNLPQFDATRALEILREQALDIPFLIVSGSIGEEVAVRAMQWGATDYLLKDRLGRLGMAIRQAIAQHRLRDAERQAKAAEREAAKRLDLAVASTGMGVWEWDLQTNAVYLSAECYKMLRTDHFDGTLAAIKAIIYPEDVRRVLHSAEIAIANRMIYSAEFRFLDAVGEMHWASNFGRCEYDATGKPLRMVGTVQEITERKRNEVDLKSSRERLAEAQRIAGIGSWAWDPPTGVVWWSEESFRLFGLDSKVVTPSYTAFLNAVHPDDRSRAEWRLQEILAGGELTEQEIRIVRPNGKILWINSRARATRDSTGALLRIEGTDQDITERKCAAESIAQSEARLRGTLDSMIEGCQIIDFEYRYLYLNPSVARQSRKARTELLGMRMTDAYPGIQTTEVFRAIQRCMTARIPEQLVNEFVFPDGTKGTFELSIQPVPEGVSILSIETTERRRAEILLQTVMKSVPDAILTVSESCVIKTVNPATERLFGYSAEELVGQDVNQMLFGYDRTAQDVSEQFRSMVARSDARPLEIVSRHRDGSDFPAELTVTDFMLEDARYFTCVIREVSERKKLEAQFLQAQKMEAVGQLAGGIAHDFNNLLMVISGYCELIMEDIRPSDRHHAAIAAISEAGSRAAGLTRQLLAFSRKQVLEPTLINLNELVSRAETMIRRLIRENVIVKVELASSLHYVKADAVQLDQVLLNLIVNARDAMPNGGQVTIRTDSLEITAESSSQFMGLPPGHYVELTVSDTGCGMTEEVKSKVFEPFFTTKAVGKGTGLGLSVVHGIVKQSGGQVRVQSELNVGTTFEILFPADGEQIAVSETSGCHNADFRGTESILLVEDETAVRQIARQILESHGYHVLEASRGTAALEVAALHLEPIKLLLTDVVMPEMGGRQLAEVLRKLQPDLRVLFMSGYTDDAAFLHGLENGTEGLIHKPFSPKLLVKKVREILDHANA
jgi:two-component system cell cycle sensor histidine kinase/response regulator CckA